MLAIVDYGVGNLYSLASSLRYLGIPCLVTGDAEELRRSERLILPGVGAFGDARRKLDDAGLAEVLREEAGNGKPLLGICLGMQLLFEESFEFGRTEGLGLLGGSVCPMEEDLRAQGFDYKVPHIGWNSLQVLHKENPLMQYVREGDFVYFVHSFYAKGCEESLVAVSEYGVTVPGTVAQGNVFGCQFHPEKSGEAGLRILRAFGELTV